MVSIPKSRNEAPWWVAILAPVMGVPLLVAMLALVAQLHGGPTSLPAELPEPAAAGDWVEIEGNGPGICPTEPEVPATGDTAPAKAPNSAGPVARSV